MRGARGVYHASAAKARPRPAFRIETSGRRGGADPAVGRHGVTVVGVAEYCRRGQARRPNECHDLESLSRPDRYDAGQTGLSILVIFIGFALATQLGGRVLDRRGARPAAVIGYALGAAGTVLIDQTPLERDGVARPAPRPEARRGAGSARWQGIMAASFLVAVRRMGTASPSRSPKHRTRPPFRTHPHDRQQAEPVERRRDRRADRGRERRQEPDALRRVRPRPRGRRARALDPGHEGCRLRRPRRRDARDGGRPTRRARPNPGCQSAPRPRT
jgi:hypothetical protein